MKLTKQQLRTCFDALKAASLYEEDFARAYYDKGCEARQAKKLSKKYLSLRAKIAIFLNLEPKTPLEKRLENAPN